MKTNSFNMYFISALWAFALGHWIIGCVFVIACTLPYVKEIVDDLTCG